MKFSYYLFRGLVFPVSLLPFSWVHMLGRVGGSLLYYGVPKYRKRCLSNLALATRLALTPQEIKKTAKASLQNSAINIFEYVKLSRLKEKNIPRLVRQMTPEIMPALINQGKGVIVFCGHQANWEILFLMYGSKYPVVAIGRPIKNTLMYGFIRSMREKFGGKVIAPKQALWGGMRALRRGSIFGIVGDQAMLKGGYSSDFLGRTAWTSPLPAILSYRTQAPIVVATTVRRRGCYEVSLSEPIYPNTAASIDVEMPRLMHRVLTLFEASVCQHPGQWFWQHNRWKQRFTYSVKRTYRHDAIAIVLPSDIGSVKTELEKLFAYYSEVFITVFLPFSSKVSEPWLSFQLPTHTEVFCYHAKKDILINDYRFKMIINLSDFCEVKKHFLKLSAFHVVSRDEVALLLG